MFKKMLILCGSVLVIFPPVRGQDIKITGELKQWHTITLTVAGPGTSERAIPNPFRQYRLQVDFIHQEKTITVAGFYAADGKAAESSAESGNQWRVHFTPDQTGQWRYRVSFRTGQDITLSSDPLAGEPDSLDGRAGTFTIGPSDKRGRDFRAQGMLRYVGKRYLQFSGSEAYFIKGGTDSPENFLAYHEFDGTARTYDPNQGQGNAGEANPSPLHKYEPHLRDWRTGDPTWQGGKGKGIVGALNYLAGTGMNAVYFLTMNVEGDGRDVWPWINVDSRDRFDCSRLDQWEIVFSHMDRLGIMMHVIFNEQENDQLLNGGEAGLERKLYYRELIARFGHHRAVVWNLGEENTNTTKQQMAYCDYIREVDPYDHPIVVHTFPPQRAKIYTPLLGFQSLEGPSLQIGNVKETHSETVKWLDRSEELAYPWFVCLDEIGPAHTGVMPDETDPKHDDVRKYGLWGNLMAGGAGCEWYFGYRYPHNDLACEDWRSRENMWNQTRIALDFFQNHLEFWAMTHHDELTPAPDAYCLAKPGNQYAIYLPAGGTTEVRLEDGTYSVHWYDPRSGGDLTEGEITALQGPGLKSIGSPPSSASSDWVVLIRKK